jgi:transcription antitermination factor NusG
MRRRTSQLPLFPGYVFACVSYQTRIELLHTGAVVRVIQVLHPGILLGELRSIRAALAASVDLVHGRVLTRGDRVRVLCGPLKDVEGVILRRRRRRKRERLILNISILGKSVATEIDLHDVECVGPRRFSNGGFCLP